MSKEKALAMEKVDPEILEELQTYQKGKYLKHCYWGPMRCFLAETYKVMAEDIYRMPLRPDDVFVVSHPRSGTTWTQELVWLVVNDINIEKAKAVSLNDRYIFLEPYIFFEDESRETMKKNTAKGSNANQMFTVPGPELLAKRESPRFVKTHLPLSLLSPNILKEAKVVYVARDPRDVVVSFYHLTKGNSHLDYTGDLNQFTDCFMRGITGWGPVLEHVKEAWRMRDNHNLLFLFYEDMCKDIHGCIRKIVEFFGKSYTDEQIAQIAEYTRFDNLKKTSHDLTSDLKDIFKKDFKEFIRKGRSGGWRESFDAEMIERINKWMTDNLKDTDLVFPSTS